MAIISEFVVTAFLTGKVPQLSPEHRKLVDEFLTHEGDFSREYFLDLKYTWKLADWMGLRLASISEKRMLPPSQMKNLVQFMYRAHPVVVRQMNQSLAFHKPIWTAVFEQAPGLYERMYRMAPKAVSLYPDEWNLSHEQWHKVMDKVRFPNEQARDKWLRKNGFIE